MPSNSTKVSRIGERFILVTILERTLMFAYHQEVPLSDHHPTRLRYIHQRCSILPLESSSPFTSMRGSISIMQFCTCTLSILIPACSDYALPLLPLSSHFTLQECNQVSISAGTVPHHRLPILSPLSRLRYIELSSQKLTTSWNFGHPPYASGGRSAANGAALLGTTKQWHSIQRVSPPPMTALSPSHMFLDTVLYRGKEY